MCGPTAGRGRGTRMAGARPEVWIFPPSFLGDGGLAHMATASEACQAAGPQDSGPSSPQGACELLNQGTALLTPAGLPPPREPFLKPHPSALPSHTYSFAVSATLLRSSQTIPPGVTLPASPALCMGHLLLRPCLTPQVKTTNIPLLPFCSRTHHLLVCSAYHLP